MNTEHNTQKTSVELLQEIYAENRSRIMKSVHQKNAFGETESEIELWLKGNSCTIQIHITPINTVRSLYPDVVFKVCHNPFISYNALDDIFYAALYNYVARKEGEADYREELMDVRTMKTKTLYKSDGIKLHIDRFPNFHKSGSITGMKEQYYGKGALLVRCGSYIYNVTDKPSIYDMAH